MIGSGKRSRFNTLHVTPAPGEDRLIKRKVILTDDQLFYLTHHYKLIPCSVLAKRLGISKYDLLTVMRENGLGDNPMRGDSA